MADQPKLLTGTVTAVETEGNKTKLTVIIEREKYHPGVSNAQKYEVGGQVQLHFSPATDMVIGVTKVPPS